VELCERAKARDWLSGLLREIVDPAGLEELAAAPTARLVVVDYAESRVAQLNVLMPLLRAKATAQHPVRMLLLVRERPRRTDDWTEALRHQSEWLDAALDECDERVLEELPLELAEREALFMAAARAFAARVETSVLPTTPPGVLGGELFSSPLLVVVAAYLAVNGDTRAPSTKAALLEDLLNHEQRYWRTRQGGIFSDDVLPRRVVGLMTLTGAESEAVAAERLRLLPDLSDATEERRRSVARWAHGLYVGTRWWNPLEPDLLGEYLVAETLTDLPAVLAGVLAERSQAIIQPLDVLRRAAADYPKLEAAVKPILSHELRQLCDVATAQALTATDRDLIYGNTATAAAAINMAVRAIKVDPRALPAAIESMPQRRDLILNSLALTLTSQYAEHLRPLAAANPAAYEPVLARSLNELSVRLAAVGRSEETLATIHEAVEISRRIADANHAAYSPYLASSLNNLSESLAGAGRSKEGLAASEESVKLRRRLVVSNPEAYEPDLANSLNNLANRLAETGRSNESLAANEEAVEIRRRLASSKRAAYESNLATSLTNLSVDLAKVQRSEDALTAIQEAVEIRQRLAAANPAGHEPDLADSLNNLSNRLAVAGRSDEALVAIQEAVTVRRRLAAANPAVYERDLASSLNNLSSCLALAGRVEQALTASGEAVKVRRRLAAANPTLYERDLASSLNNFSVDLSVAGRVEEALAASQEAVKIRRRLAADNPPDEPNLADSLTNLSIFFAMTGRAEDALAAIQEAEEVRRRLAATDPNDHEADLADRRRTSSIDGP
jgi:tetratricopeptide (TPR) repeat protein